MATAQALTEEEAAAVMKARGVPKGEIEAAIPRRRRERSDKGKPRPGRRKQLSLQGLQKIKNSIDALDKKIAAGNAAVARLTAQRKPLVDELRSAFTGLQQLLGV